MTRLLSAAAVGTAMLLLWTAWSAPATADPMRALRGTATHASCRNLLDHAAMAHWRVRSLLLVCLAVASASGLFGLVVTAVPALALVCAAVGAWSPIGLVRGRATARRKRRREAWPDAVDHVASAVRAGLSIPEALRQLAKHGPEILRDDFAAFARHDAAHGRFDDSLDVLKERLADPAADRLIESLRLARNVGGSDVGRLLRTLSAFLREDAATRAELAAKQSWTVSAARLALAAPWLALIVVGFRGEGLEAYRTPQGVMILIFGAVISWVAYVLMKALGRLPDEERVMR